MVEGPGCKVKGELMKKRIKGKTIVNTVAEKKGVAKDISTRFVQLHGLQVSDIRTLGKELFIFMAQSPFCIRIHFLMDGSVRYGDSKDKNAQTSEPCLTIFFNDTKLFVFKSSIDVRLADESSQHCDELADLDINASSFNFKRAQKEIEKQQSELICDVIMDQMVLPGVGNIIKNEGLFKSGINPISQVKDLSSSLIGCLIHRLRDFSAVFYTCRKTNKPLKPHMCIYEKTKCPQCDSQVTVCKPGNLKRLTFFCSKCQVNSSLNLPKKNSLLGFLQLSDVSTVQKTWECPRCTYLNDSASPTCIMCLCQKPYNSDREHNFSSEELQPQTLVKRDEELKIEKSRECPHCTFLNDSTSATCIICSGQMPDIRKRKLSNEDSQPQILAKKEKKEIKIQEKAVDVARKRVENGDRKIPLCPGHGKNCSVRSVKRPGENLGRLFYTCSLGGNKQCKYFQWADLHHPLCKHEKRSILRRVLKQNENNGREFYCCPLPKKDQCDLFQWA
ncbi:endonuclease 8-like 3 [Frankliniella occidentalis]|uniref:Endonuclease 8-like 3 n=1 Tax=Frankliniella occidentalis TaxID=133901 RepID=A0A6J1SRT1_FRAOC|nr:endonuclease 8-like 3 [Frankliniella occidentalis]